MAVSTLLLLSLSLVAIIEAQLVLFNTTSFAGSATLSQTCKDALSASIPCDPALLRYATGRYVGSIDQSFLSGTLCTAKCSTGLATYRNTVAAKCSVVDAWPGFPATHTGDFLWAYQNQTCLKDSTGAWCINKFASMTIPSNTNRVEDLSHDQLCSPCLTATFQQIQMTGFSSYSNDTAKSWAKVQSICSTSPYATSLPKPVSSGSLVSFGTGAGFNTTVDKTKYQVPPCLSGKTYTATAADTCIGISDRFNVSTGTLKTINGLYVDCSNLVAGTVLCLPKPCTIYCIVKGDTCESIAKAYPWYQLSKTKLAAYNAALNNDCTNLVVGDSYCFDPPNGKPTPAIISGMKYPTPTYATSRSTSSTAAPVPSPTPSGIIKTCNKYAKSNPGGSCTAYATNQKISQAQLYAWNGIFGNSGENCSKFQANTYYCTGVSGPLPAPGPYQKGVIDTCVQYAKTNIGASCTAFASRVGITLAQLYTWNTILGSAGARCKDYFIANEYYCVAVAGAKS